MKRREIENAERLLLSQTEVSDDVLNKARGELAEKQKSREPKPRRRLKYLIPAVSCVLVCSIVIPIVFVMTSPRNLGEEPLYLLEELEKREISSVRDYNAEYGAQYYAVPEEVEGVEAFAYSRDGTDILLCETFFCQGEECEWYVLIDAMGYAVDILRDFYDCSDTLSVNGFEIYCDLAAGEAYFTENGSSYFLSAPTGYDGLTEILSLLLEN